jgi:phosphate transport system substrate-binding protein
VPLILPHKQGEKALFWVQSVQQIIFEENRFMIKVRNLVLALVSVLAIALTSVKAQEQTIAEIAIANPDFSTLVSLVVAADLADVLAGEGPFTVFAPTNAAFEKIPAEVLAYVAGDQELLTRILTYHVISGKVMSADIAMGEMEAPTMEMGSVGGDMMGGAIMVNNSDAGITVDGVSVIAADIEASNGVIHVIDTVLLPEITLPEVDPLSVEGDILVAGSSTVLPVSERMASLFTDAGFAGNLSVEGGGTGAGFEKFCVNAETDIADASRGIRDAEAEACVTSGRPAVGFQVGTDALAIAVSIENTFLESINIETLAQIFAGNVSTWDQVNPNFPAETIQLFSPGSDSGTFDYFVEAVMGDLGEEALLGAAGIQLSEDDNVLVTGVESSPFAIGYFGGAYYFANTDRLRAVPVEGIAPSAQTAENGTYPLARPLYIYSSAAVIAEKPQVGAFINYYLTNVDAQLGVEEGQIGYFPASRLAERYNRLTLLSIMGMGM